MKQEAKAETGGNKVKKLWHQVKSTWKEPPKERFLTSREVCDFGVFALGVSFMTSAVNSVATFTLIPMFFHISSLHAYIIVALSSVVNLCIIPYVANKIEKTRTKWGRYKPYILLALPLYVILTLLVTWLPQLESESSRVLYAYMTCIPLLITNTFFYNMYQTFPTIITPNAQERADIMTPIGMIVGFAPTILSLIMGPMRAYFSDTLHKEYLSIRILGIISVVLGTLCVINILRVKERVYSIESEENKEEKIKLKDSLKMLSQNKPLIILTIALILGSLTGFSASFRGLIVQIRYAEDVRTALNISGIPMNIIGLAYTVSMLLLPVVTRKMDKRNILILFHSIGVVCNLILAIVGYERIPIGMPSAIIVTLLHFIMQINPAYLLIPIMLGEIADYQQYKTGKRLDGHIQNMLFNVPAVFSQIMMVGTFALQKRIGFEPRDYSLDLIPAGETFVYSQHLQDVANTWFNAISIISAISGILMIVVLIFYPLSRKKHQEVVDALKEKSTITNVDTEQLAEDGFVLAEEEMKTKA